MPAEKKDDGTLPLGDASHLIDNVPPAKVERTLMPVPVAQRVVTPEGEVIRDAKPTDKPVGILPGDVIRGVSGQEQVADVKRALEPCPECRHAHWPNADEFRWIEGFLSNYFGSIPTWMVPYVPGRNPKEYVICAGAPHGKSGPVHMMNSCEHFRAKRGSPNRRGLLARMFGRFARN